MDANLCICEPVCVFLSPSFSVCRCVPVSVYMPLRVCVCMCMCDTGRRGGSLGGGGGSSSTSSALIGRCPARHLTWQLAIWRLLKPEATR